MIDRTIKLLVPALALVYYLAADRMGLPYLTEVLLTTVVIVGTFNFAQWRKDGKYDGDLVVEEVDEFKANYSFELNGPAEDLAEKSRVAFKVIHKA